MDSSSAFGQPVSFRIGRAIPPDIQKNAGKRQDNHGDCEPFQVDDKILVDGLFDVAVDFDVAEFQLHGNLLLVVGYRKL